ncbi:MAG: histidine-type phosphatase [Sphingomonas sp.]
MGLLGAGAAPAASGTTEPGLTVEHVVFLMRHGVRPPTSDPGRQEGFADLPWPSWSVPYGWLTNHGAAAIRLLGASDRAWLQDEGLLPRTGCPEPGTVTLASDSEQRTVATGDAWALALEPRCEIANQHPPETVRDPLFTASADKSDLDTHAANMSLLAQLGPDGIAGIDRQEQDALRTIDHILCGARQAGCGLPDKSSRLEEPEPGKQAKVSGALSRGSNLAQILLLEYADGKPMNEVGWGRASAADIARVGSLHSTGFALSARVPYVAQRSFLALRERMRVSLDDGGPKVAMFVGHDGTVSSLGGLLGLHWSVPGFAADDPAPGGALVFETVRDGSGNRFVRAFYRSHTLEQIRNLSPDAPFWQPLPIAGCGSAPLLLCPKATFDQLLARKS